MSNNQSESSKGDQSQELHHDNQEHDILENTTIVNKNYQVSDESSQSDIKVETQSTKVTKYVKEEQLQYDFKDKVNLLKYMNLNMLKIPVAFPQIGNLAQSIQNKPYLEQYFAQSIRKGLIIKDNNSFIAKNNEKLQQKINELQSKSLDYSFFMDFGVEAEFLFRDIQLEKDMLLLNGEDVMFRTLDKNQYQAFFNWDINKKLQGDILQLSDTVALKIYNKNEQIGILQGRVKKIDLSVIIIELEQKPEQICIQNVKDFDGEKYNPLVLKQNSINNLQIYFINHLVYTSDIEVSYDFTRVSDTYLKELMKEATSFITESYLPNILVLKGNDFHKNLELASKQIPNRKQIFEIIEEVKYALQEQNNYLPNKFQTKAIKQSLTNSISLIQGCPGGGKTYTSAVIAQCLLKLYTGKKVLCGAGSNTASDNLTLY